MPQRRDDHRRPAVLDALVRSVHLFRSRLSIVAFTGVIISANRLFETDTVTVPPTLAVGVVEGVTAFALIIPVRAYMRPTVAGEPTDNPVTIYRGVHRGPPRAPASVVAVD